MVRSDPDPVNLSPDPQLMTGTNLAGFVGLSDVEAAYIYSNCIELSFVHCNMYSNGRAGSGQSPTGSATHD